MQIGQHVLCIKTRLCSRYLLRHGCTIPVVGTVYTIREIFNSPLLREADQKYIYLIEIRNPPLKFRDIRMPTEPGWRIEWFKPLNKLRIEDFIGKEVTNDECVDA